MTWIPIILMAVGSVTITFFIVIFIIATIRVLKQEKGIVKKTDRIGAKEKVIAVLYKGNGQKEFIQ